MAKKNYKCKFAMRAVAFCCLSLPGLLFQSSYAFAVDQSTLAAGDDERVSALLERSRVLESQLRRLQTRIVLLERRKPRHTQATQQASAPVGTRRAPSGVTILGDPYRPIFILGMPVISSPYIGMATAYDASDLVVNQPYVNEDLYLLQQRKRLYSYLQQQNNYPPMTTPVLNLSGRIEVKISHGGRSDRFQSGSMTDINLTGIELDTEILVNEWTTGLMAFVYDSTPPSMSPRRIDNSRVFLERGFLTFGNLARFPLYVTAGQFYAPFGQYSSVMISDPLTKILGRIKARAIALGFYTGDETGSHVNGSAFLFRGPTRTSLDNRGLHNYGANITYAMVQPKWSVELGSSYIRSIADSLGMQHNGDFGVGDFGGFATSDATEVMNPVSGLDARGTLRVGPCSLTAEYVTAAHSFDISTLSFGTRANQHGARPWALHTEAVYKFSAWSKPSQVMVGYGQSGEALALLLPRKRYVAMASTSLWRDTIEGIEFRHDVDYGATSVATGQRLNPITATGRVENTLTLQVGLYF